jgi:hypothetical protein
MNYIRDELKSQGYDVEALFIHYTETILKEYSYRSFCQGNDDVPVYTFDNEIQTFWRTYKNAEQLVDKQYLQYVEKKYCKDLPFGILLMSTQLFTTPYHYRFYFIDLTESEKLYWVQLVFKNIEKILEVLKPDRIVDIESSELGRSVLCQVAKANKIPYATLESARYESYWLATFTLGRTTDQYFINRYKKNLESQEMNGKYVKMVNDFRHQEKIMLADYKYNSTAKTSSTPLIKDLRKLWATLRVLFNYWGKNPSLVGLFRRRPMIANLFDSLAFIILWFFRERYLLSRRTNFFCEPDKADTYVYFPLHLVPESTTLVKSPLYPNEISVIEAVSKSLPMGWKLYLKEHGAMVGERPIEFYKAIKRLTNVKFVRMDAYDDPKPWIQNSVGVITLSGSSAFEAAMMGKPSLIFGSVFFELIEGINKVNSFSELPEKIIKMKSASIDNTKSCGAYLQTVQELGKYIPFTELMVTSQRTMFNNEPLPKKLKSVIIDLVEILMLDVNNMDCQ